jgi:hypothetical protein
MSCYPLKELPEKGKVVGCFCNDEPKHIYSQPKNFLLI